MSTHRKEGFWIGAKGGLIDWKHYKRMGNAVWLYLYLLRCQTAVSQLGEGVVYYGHPITLDFIRHETVGIPVRTLKAWVARLRKQGYIRTADHGCKGLVFWIANAKHKTKKAIIHRVATSIPRKPPVGFGHIGVPIGAATGHKTVQDTSQVGPESTRIDTSLPPYSNEPGTLAAESVSATPKGFISEILSDLNKATAAQNAASTTSLLNEKVQTKPQHHNPRQTPKAVDVAFRAWLDQHAERDPDLAEYRKAHGL